MTKATQVIFDIGNVCVAWDPRLLYEKLIDDPKRLEWFLGEVVTLEWHTHHDKGRLFADGVRALTAAFPKEAALIEAFDKRWEETIGGEITGTTTLINQLAAAYVPLYGLTNFSAEKYPAFARQYAFTRHFRDVLVSGEVGLVKPDPAIYALAIDRFGINPAETLFVDDREVNTAAAKAMGLQVHRFENPEGLRACLEGHGLL